MVESRPVDQSDHRHDKIDASLCQIYRIKMSTPVVYSPLGEKSTEKLLSPTNKSDKSAIRNKWLKIASHTIDVFVICG